MPGKRRTERRDALAPASQRELRLRIIGGLLRGRAFQYDGDTATRPMKDRVREAVFNLVGPAVRGKLVIDLFAGTGAMAFEALSRGAARAVLIERRFPACQVIRDNAASLGLTDQLQLTPGDAWVWSRQIPSQSDQPWLVFVCPPYDFFVSKREETLALLADLCGRSPPGSLMVVECDERFDPEGLPRDWQWDVRRYPPAVIAIGEERSQCSSESPAS